VETHCFDTFSWALLEGYLRREREGYPERFDQDICAISIKAKKKAKKGKER
jgi:hypothetical protein